MESVVAKCNKDLNEKPDKHKLNVYFPQNEEACFWPTTCDYLPICHLKDWKGDSVSPDVRKDPVGSGLYKWREPHYKLEKVKE